MEFGVIASHSEHSQRFSSMPNAPFARTSHVICCQSMTLKYCHQSFEIPRILHSE